jgi:lysyl-tRNA synthetase class II
LEQLLQTIVLDVFQTTEIQIGGQARSFRGPFERRTFHELLLSIGLDIDQYPTEEAVRDAVKQLGFGCESMASA